MTELILYSRAAVLEVRVELRAPGQAAELERLVMQAIASGVDDVQSLRMLFGLTPRIMVDLLGDIWKAGWITVDLGAAHEAIRLSLVGEDILQRRSGDTARSTVSSSPVLLDRVTGRVLGIRAGSARADRRFVVPYMEDDRDPRDVRVGELTEAVKQNLRGKSDEDLGSFEDQRIASVRPAPQVRDAALATRYIPVQAAVSRDGDAVRVRITDELIPLTIREQSARRVEAYIRENPETDFARSVRGQAAQLAERAKTAGALLEDLTRAAQHLESAEAGTRQSRHGRLAHLAAQIAGRVKSLAEREMEVRIVDTAESHEEALRDLIRLARTQLIVAIPRVNLHVLARYRPLLEDAVRRGVRVFLLWGLERGDSLDERVKLELWEIGRRGQGGGGLRFADRPAELHAKVAIADDRAALVTSKNFFSQSDFAELGALVTSQLARRAPAVEELLGWAARRLPDYELQLGILRTAEEFGTGAVASDWEPPALPEYDPRLDDLEPNDPALELWGAAWRTVGQELSHALARPKPVVRPIEDGLHHTLVRDLLEDVQHRMVVSSHRLSAPVINRDLTSRAAQAQARGASIELVFGELDTRTTTPDDLHEASESADGISIRARDRSHAKVLVADHTAVIGSFNYLSFTGVSRRRMSSEVSLEITSPDTAARVLQVLGSEATPVPGRSHPPAPSRVADIELARRLSMKRKAGELTTPETVADLLGTADAPAVLEALANAGDDSTRNRVMLALAALGSNPGRERLLGELVEKAAAAAAWQPAAALRAALTDSDELPSRELADAVAAEADDLELHLEALDWADRDIEALALHLATGVLLESEVTAVEYLARHLDDLQGAREPVVAALRHAQEFGQVDPHAVAAEREKRSASADLLAGWHALDEAIDRLRNVDVRVLAGRKVIDHVFSKGEEFYAVEVIAAARDAGALLAWLAEHQDDDVRWVDQAAKRARTNAIVAGLRTRFATRRGHVRRAARDVVAASGRPAGLARDLLPGELRSLQQVVESMTQAAVHTGTPYGYALAAVAVQRLAATVAPVAGQVPAFPFWRVPRLSLAASASPSGRASTAARDLFEVSSPSDAFRALLREHDLAHAEGLLTRLEEGGDLGAGEADALQRALRREQEKRAEATEARAVELLSRAQSLGTDAPVAEQVRRRESRPSPALNRALDEEEAALERHEALLRARLDQQLASLPATELNRRTRIADLAQAGELALASDLLSRSSRVPAPMKTPPVFPWTGLALHDILAKFDLPELRQRHFEDFVPTADDERGQRVVAALRALPGAPQEYLAAVQALVRPDAEPPVLLLELGEPYVRFALPDAANTQWARNHEVTVAVGKSKVKAVFRIATEMEPDTPGPVLRVDDVLTLLHAPDAESRLEYRQRGLLRLVAAQLPVSDVVDSSITSQGASRLHDDAFNRLLHLVGLNLHREVESDVLHDMFGAHPFVLWQVVEHLRGLDVARLSLAEVRAKDKFAVVVVRAVVDDLSSDAAAASLAVLATFGDDSGLSVEDLADAVALVADELGVDAGTTQWAVEDAVAQLVRQDYVVRNGDGQLLVPRGAVWYALRRAYPHRNWLPEALRRTFDIARADDQLRVDHDLLLSLLHQMRGVAVEAGARYGREVRLGVNDLRDPEVPVPLRDLLLVARSALDASPEVFLDIVQPSDANVLVRGPFAHLAVLLQGALQNAAQAIRRAASDTAAGGFIRVETEVASDSVVLRVIDSGPGFDQVVLTSFGAGLDVPSSHGERAGRGLAEYRAYNGTRGATVVLSNGDGGGAAVEIRVPRVAATAPSRQ